MTIIQLTVAERAALGEIVQHHRDGQLIRRAQALLLLDMEEAVAEAAEQLHLSRQALYVMARRFVARSTLSIEDRLADAPRSGRPRTKSEQVESKLPELLAKKPIDYGYRSFAWTAGLLKLAVEKASGIDISEPTIRLNLHRMGYRYKRSRYILARRAPHWRQAKGGSKEA